MEGNVREMSAKRMIREIIFVEIEHEVDEQNEDLQDYEETTKEQLRIEDEKIW